MNIRLLTTVLVAALLLTGTVVAPISGINNLQQDITATEPQNNHTDIPAQNDMVAAQAAPANIVEPKSEPMPAEVPATEAPTEPTATEAPALISADEAKAIALKHAGLTAKQVTKLKAEFDVDDGVKEYDVEFRSGDYEYDYTIHAETGKVRSHDKEYDPKETAPKETKPKETAPKATEPKATEPTATEAPALISADEAKAIALKHAGLTAKQVTKLKAEFDVDDGVKEYDVEFRSGDYEYDYTIHAESGKIRSHDKELDD